SRGWARAIAARRRSSHFVHELTLQFGPELFFPACQTLLDLHFLAGDGLLGRDADLRDLVLVLRFHLGNAALVLRLDLRNLDLVRLLHFLELRIVLGLHLLELRLGLHLDHLLVLALRSRELLQGHLTFWRGRIDEELVREPPANGPHHTRSRFPE